MRLTNELGLPEALVKVVGKTAYPPKPKRYGVTTLLKGDCEIILTKRFHKEVVEDVSDDIWALFGTAVHRFLEENDSTGLAETSWQLRVGDAMIVGKTDLYDPKARVLYDYKTCSVWKIVKRDFADWRRQALAYAWGLWQTKGVMLDKAVFVAFIKDWSETEMMRSGADYPRKAVAQVEFPFTEAELTECGEALKAKVMALEREKHWATARLTPCTPEERWESPTTYAVYRGDAKRALRVFDTLTEAKDMADREVSMRIEERKGGSVKCERYCRVAGFCPLMGGKDERGA